MTTAPQADEFTLRSKDVMVTVDLARGADIVALVDIRTGIDVLFRTPWAERARHVSRHGSLLWHGSSAEAWLESYRGGWQLLCPNAGPSNVRNGIEQGFHGEAAVVPWSLDSITASTAILSVELFSAPLSIQRTLSLDGPSVVIEDTVTNMCSVPVDFDYQHHPAFGEPFLSPNCCIDTGARTFTVGDEGDQSGVVMTGGSHNWPPAIPGRFGDLGLDRMPVREDGRAVLGWLSDFEEPWAAVRNPDLDLAVGLSWDGTAMPHAWFWQELNASKNFPWFARAYVMAIEPSSTGVAGADRLRTLHLDADASIDITMRTTLCSGRRAIKSIDSAGRVYYAE